MARFHVGESNIDGVFIIDRLPIRDERGFFSRFFCSEELFDLGFEDISQINHTRTVIEGSVRGMHFQNDPYSDRKFISCVRGAVFDVAVDMRRNSPTYLQWHGEILSEDNARSLLVPPGFAHGFQTLTADCEMIYLHDKPHAPGAEGGLHPLDPEIDISWPLPIAQMSERDASRPFL